MIVKMKPKTTEKQVAKLINFFKEKGIEFLDISSDEYHAFRLEKTPYLKEIRAFDDVELVLPLTKRFSQISRENQAEDTVIKVKGKTIDSKTFSIIAGPCSIESEEQLIKIAKTLKKNKIGFLRGGAYKARTSPYDFQGLELAGLMMLNRIAAEYDLITVSEIPSADLIPLFEEYVDIIQVGARNMQNYHLLKALGKATKPILLKRGFGATIEEWLMAAEYLFVHGNRNIIMCERGIRTFETYTRNTLDISSVLAIKELTHLPVIVDPSHASGRYQMVEPLSLAALAAGADGIMVEIHPEPTKALSDGAQSLKPSKFTTMIEKIDQLLPLFDKKR